MSEKEYAAERIAEDFSPDTPVDDIVCKDCTFRKRDLVVNGKTVVKGYKNGYCQIYSSDKGKPNSVLFSNSDCEYYEKE